MPQYSSYLLNTSLLSDGVLSPKAVRITPIKPVVREGSSLFITCALVGAHFNSNDAPYLNFELPEMPNELESNISLTNINGK